jgi:hypothetical protein
LFGDDKTEGWISKVRHLMRVLSSLQWAGGVAGGIIITLTVSAFIYLVVSHPVSIIP